MNFIELTAVIFSIIYVILASKEKYLCWIASIISVSLYLYICYNAKLYAETALQVFYLIMSFYGLWNWRNKKRIKLKIKEISISKHLFIIILGCFLTFIFGFLLSHFTDAKMPVLDSFTTVFSAIATYMIAKKILENWIYWIVIDIASVYLYHTRGLELTAILFIFYTIIAINGYFTWLKKYQVD